MHPLIQAWRKFDEESPPYVLAGDEVVLNTSYSVRCRSWKAYCSNPDFEAPDQGKFHIDLLPVPFAGRLDRATIFVLLLNPGFGPHDYFAEYEVPEFRQIRIANLRQGRRAAFDYLSPEFSWHGGFRYWHGRLSGLVSAFASETGLSYGRARKYFQSQIASIELVPYHSKRFAFPSRLASSLRSAQLAKAYVHDVLLPNARRKDCLVIATRAVGMWELPKSRNVVAYEGPETRSGHLSPGSRGGESMLNFLRERFDGAT